MLPEQSRSFNPWEASGGELYKVITACEEYTKNSEQREKAMADACQEHWNLLQAEGNIRTRIAVLDCALQHTADQMVEGIKKWGLDYEGRKAWDAFVKNIELDKEQLISDLSDLIDKRADLCKKFGIEFC